MSDKFHRYVPNVQWKSKKRIIRHSNSWWKTCSTLQHNLHNQDCQFIISMCCIHRRNDPWRCQAGVKQGHCVTGSHVTEMQWRSLACQCRWSGIQGGEMIEGANGRKRKRRMWRVSVKNQTWTQGKWEGGCWLLTRYTVKQMEDFYVCQIIGIDVWLYEKKNA